MILYVSNATAYSIYDDLFSDGRIQGGYQMQKFNHNLITGIGQIEDTIALSALPYNNVRANRFDREINGIRYVGIKNCTGFAHKFSNLLFLYLEGSRIIRKNKPRCIICDAIAKSPCYISLLLGKQFHIPVIGIITDLPGMLSEKGTANKGISRMQGFNGYILLTEQMNSVVNPNKKPYMIMEGLCAAKLPDIYAGEKKKVLIYSGSLWKKNAGIEYLVKGFIAANVPEYELHFYGTGELVEWIVEISKTYPRIQYKGCVSNSEIVKRQFEATLLVNPRPSDEEFCKYSFPSKTIEYMASGTPVLMTRLPGVPKEYFDYVYSIDEETPDGVCHVLKDLLIRNPDQLRAFGVRGREYVANEKSCEKQCGRIVRFVNDIVAL